MGAFPRAPGRVVVQLVVSLERRKPMRRTIPAPLLASLASLASCTGADDLSHPGDLPHQSNAGLDWRDQMIYQIVVDRFADGDRDNDFDIEPSVPAKSHGGDWQGV